MLMSSTFSRLGRPVFPSGFSVAVLHPLEKVRPLAPQPIEHVGAGGAAMGLDGYIEPSACACCLAPADRAPAARQVLGGIAALFRKGYNVTFFWATVLSEFALRQERGPVLGGDIIEVDAIGAIALHPPHQGYNITLLEALLADF